MKKITLQILVLSTLMISSISYGQIGNLNKLKKKVKSKTEIKKKGDSSSSSSSSSEKTSTKIGGDGAPKYNSEDPIYKSYSKVKENLKYTKSIMEGIEWRSNIEGSNQKAIKYLNQANENMTFLKENGEESKKYYAEFEKQYAELDSKRASDIEDYEIDMVYEKKMEQYYYWAKLGRDIQDKTLKGSYKGYNDFKADFKNQRVKKYETSLIKKYTSAVDNYLTVEVYEDISYYNEKVDRIIKNIHKITDRNEEAYKLGAKSFVRDFDDALIEINYYDEFLLENKDEINKVKTKLDGEKSILDKYISSGEYDAYIIKFKQELVDAVRLRPNGMRNSTYEAMAKKGVKKGTATRASIASNRWIVSRTAFGYPKYKFLPVDIAVSHEGKCYLAYGQLVQDYQGGGVYGKVYFDYGSFQEEMNCNNTNK